MVADNPFRELNKLGKPVLTHSTVRPADRRKRRRYLRPEEFKMLIASVERKAKTLQGITAADRVMAYRLAANTGLRKKELSALRHSDFDFERGSVFLAPLDSKNREGAIQPLPPHLLPALRSWLELKPVGALILPLAKKRTAEMLAVDLAGTGIPVVDDRGLTVDFHALRSTYAAGMALNRVPMPVVSKLMRHSRVDLTVQLYLGLGLDDYSDAMEKLPEF